MEVDVKRFYVDFLGFFGYKGLMGLIGIGVFYINSEFFDVFELLFIGGGIIEDVDFDFYKLVELLECFEVGMLNIGGVIGFVVGICYIERIGIEKIEK